MRTLYKQSSQSSHDWLEDYHLSEKLPVDLTSTTTIHLFRHAGIA